MALAAGLAELGGGLLLAIGLLTPLAAFAIAVVMVNAIAAAHWRNGFWNRNGGAEYNVVILAVVVALAATGAGRFSLDALLRWDSTLSGAWCALVVVVGAAALSAATLSGGRSRSAPRDAGTAAERTAEERPIRKAA